MKRISYLSIIVLTATLYTSVAQAQWVQTNGPYGASVYSITSFGNDIFIGTEGGVFESTDSGSSWQKKSDGLPADSYIETLTSCGSNIFAGVGRNGVYRSTNSGDTWSSASVGLPNSFIVNALGSDGRSLFIPNGASTYTSSNGGNYWNLVDTNLTKFANPDAVITVDSTTYLAGGWIIRTTDDGSSWGVTSVSQDGNAWDILSMQNMGETLFVINRPFDIFCSTDHGANWENVSPPIPTPSSSYLYLAAIGSELFAGSFYGTIYRTIDSGKSWQLLSGLPANAEMCALISDGTELLAGFHGLGMFRSFDRGVTWTQCNQGLINTSVNAISTIGDTTIVGTNDGVFISSDYGSSWQSRQNGLPSYNIESFLSDSGNLYAGSQGGYIIPNLFLSTDWGSNWASPDSGLMLDNVGAIVRCGLNLIAGGDPDNAKYGFYNSTNGGLSWSACSVSSGYTNIVVSGMLSIGTTVLAATNGLPYKSDDGGLTWFESGQGIEYSRQVVVWAIGATMSKVFIDCTPNGPGNLGIYISDDDGSTWQHALDTIFPSRGDVTCFASFGDSMFAATDSLGIFLTTDNGAHWLNENLGLSDTNILSLAIQGDELLAGTATSGVWRRPLAEMIASLSVASAKQTQDAISVYPDPASSIVTISCPELTGTTKASLISETGATVWQKTILTDGTPFQIDLTGVSNGAYRLELQSGTVSQSSKIILQR